MLPQFVGALYSPLSFISHITFPAILNASTPDGTPTYIIVCLIASEISSSVSPLLMAPLMCADSSGPRFSAMRMPMLSNDRCFLSRPGRPQLAQQTSVMYSWPGFANGSEPCHGLVRSAVSNEVMPQLPLEARKSRFRTPASALSTYASPSTSRRIFIPCIKASEGSELLDISDGVKDCTGGPLERGVAAFLAFFEAFAWIENYRVRF